jgi:hypothetical protein
MHEILAGSVTAGDSWMNLTVGDSLQLPPTLALTGAPTLKDAQSRDITLQSVVAADGRMTFRSQPITRPGLYTLSTGAATLPVAVNVPADAEADIRVLDDGALRSALGGIELELLADEIPTASATADRGANDFGWMVMLVLLGLVGVECVMAWRFGHYRR